MKAILVGGSFHAVTIDILRTNSHIQMTPESGSHEKETFSLFSVKNKEGTLFALYAHENSTQKQINEILINFL